MTIMTTCHQNRWKERLMLYPNICASMRMSSKILSIEISSNQLWIQQIVLFGSTIAEFINIVASKILEWISWCIHISSTACALTINNLEIKTERYLFPNSAQKIELTQLFMNLNVWLSSLHSNQGKTTRKNLLVMFIIKRFVEGETLKKLKVKIS